jgi:hypothetical protein
MSQEARHGGSDRRFQINPEPLRVRDEVLTPDTDAGRCEATLKNGAGRCLNDATWLVLSAAGESGVCGLHARHVCDDPQTMAMERLP